MAYMQLRIGLQGRVAIPKACTAPSPTRSGQGHFPAGPERDSDPLCHEPQKVVSRKSRWSLLSFAIVCASLASRIPSHVRVDLRSTPRLERGPYTTDLQFRKTEIFLRKALDLANHVEIAREIRRFAHIDRTLMVG